MVEENDPPLLLMLFYNIGRVGGAVCGFIALIGMFRWGSRYWAFAIAGLAISLFYLGMAFIGSHYGGD